MTTLYRITSEPFYTSDGVTFTDFDPPLAVGDVFVVHGDTARPDRDGDLQGHTLDEDGEAHFHSVARAVLTPVPARDDVTIDRDAFEAAHSVSLAHVRQALGRLGDPRTTDAIVALSMFLELVSGHAREQRSAAFRAMVGGS